MTDNDKKLHQLTEGVTRIANYMEEILQLVRADQERSKKYTTYSKNEDDFMGSENRIESE